MTFVHVHYTVHDNYDNYRGDSLTVQADKVSATAWMDRKTMMTFGNCQPSETGTVLRKQKNGWNQC